MSSHLHLQESPMANSFLATLHGVGFTLPDGGALFHDLHETFAAETVALIGRNGSGKSTLGRLVAGELAPTWGRIERAATILRVGQEAGTAPGRSLAQLAGLHKPLAALRRLAAGNGTAADADAVGERWDLEAQWQALLDKAGLHAAMCPESLSGGQRALLALIGGFCSNAGLLVLDEPSNHLDRERRGFLSDSMTRWRQAGRGLLLITHDRALLEQVDRTLELRPPGLLHYGGGWSTVTRQREAELAASAARLEHARTERRRTELDMRQQAERAARKSARGARDRHSGSQSKLMLDAQQDRVERTDGALAERHAKRRGQLRQQVADAFAALDGALERPAFPELGVTIPARQETLVLDGLVQGWAWTRPLDWIARGPVRVAISGPNGGGKSTLLRLLGGRDVPSVGRLRCSLPSILLDQSLALLDQEASLLDQLRAVAPACLEGRLRQYLALAGIGSSRVHLRCAQLSGGEQMRGALLAAVLAEPMPRMLLLDEPTNHLDLAATEALESMLQSWRGALVVVSHDDAFLRRLGPTHRIERHDDGWRVTETAGGRA
jgi:ATPase subunit of ABC transporter with duplicated ATPase domains